MWVSSHDLSIVFPVQGTGGSPTGPDPENRVVDQDIGSPGRPVSSGLQVPAELRHCRARARTPWWTYRCVFPSKCPSIARAEKVILRVVSLTLWKIISVDDAVLIPKNRGEIFSTYFCTRNFLGWGEPLCHHYIDCCFVPGQCDITRFHSFLQIATGNHLDRAEKKSKFSQTGTVDVFDPRSGISRPTSRRASARPNLHEWWIQPAHVRCPVAQLLIYPTASGHPRLACEFAQ